MKFKDMLIPISLALLTTWLIQYWFLGSKKAGVEESPTSFVAPKTKQETEPLNKEIDFIDEKRFTHQVLTEVETDVAKYVFSSDGAAIERLELKGNTIGKLAGLGSIFPPSDTEKENKFLLLAFNEKTPYYYKLVERDDKQDSTEILYRYDSPNSDFLVDKKFTVYKNTYKVDLQVVVTPKKEPVETKSAKENGSVETAEGAFRTRLFFASPLMPELGDTDVLSSVVCNKVGDFNKTDKTKLNDASGNFCPKLFGTDSKYFVHAMVDDPSCYAQRAYYKIVDGKKIFSILEGPTSNKKQSYSLSFYFGPKEDNALLLVDKRLEKTLDYSGWLSGLSRFLMEILKFLNKYLKNYGLSIIILTLIIRLLLLPFSIKADAGTKKQAEFQKKLQYLQTKYKDDKAALAAERAELVKKHGMPGLSGCLPILLQLPIFIALSNLLRSSIEMYKAPFVFWIQDLSAKDPYYILPACMSIAMLIQAFTVDPKQRLMMVVMALAVGPLFASFSAGLSLYIAASVGFGLVQTFLVKKFKQV